MSSAHHFHGIATLPVMLATAAVHGDLYDSYYEIPCGSGEFSTERKLVKHGEGRALKHFLQSPVHTSRDPAQPATRILPDWIYQGIEKYIVEHGHGNAGYALELVGNGEPWIGWVLQRLKSRRSMRYHQEGPFSGSAALLKERADEFQLAYWRHNIHFVLRINAFGTENSMANWAQQHQAKIPIDRQREHDVLDRSVPPVGTGAKPWFESMGSFSPIRLHLDDQASQFAFRKLSFWQLGRAYFNRGPDNPIVNFFNIPLEAASLHWESFQSGNLLTKFCCDLRLEIYTLAADNPALAA